MVKVNFRQAFPTIYDFGLTTNLQWFMVMQKPTNFAWYSPTPS
jgi:hypothetical protein